jgi:hypothetical protein
MVFSDERDADTSIVQLSRTYSHRQLGCGAIEFRLSVRSMRIQL